MSYMDKTDFLKAIFAPRQSLNVGDVKESIGMNSRVQKVKCYRCGKTLETPNMYGKKLELLDPYCPSATIFVVQWLIHHGWHCLTSEATPSGAFLCPDCFQEGQPEYHRSSECGAWCEQAEKWMMENNGKQ
jgi:hypothetical protein